MDEPRLSAPTLRVLMAFMSAPQDELSGAQIGRTANVLSGTLYPTLARFERAGWLKSRWEEGDPHSLGRPRRRFYRLTGLGERKTKAAIRELEPAFRRLAWN
jgi:PadR family transcriptional regulator, regulatory protein PadR